jgi:hypothetical protein
LDADRGRVFEALRQRLGDAVMIEGTSAAAAQGTAGALWVKVSALTVGVGLFAGALAVTSKPAPPTAPAHVNVVAAPAAAPLPPKPAPAPLASAEAPEVAAAPAEQPASAVRRPTERLTQEVALLSRAASELHAGRAGEALKTLDEHRRQFPNGILAEERRAARAQALCALGRHSEAELELARLARTAPQSMQTARARQACGVR